MSALPYVIVCDSRASHAAWLAHRCSGIGASEIAAVLGESPWQSALSVYAAKVDPAEPDADESEWLAWGHKLEPIILAEFAARTGRLLRPGGLLLRSHEHPWALATLDAEASADEGTTWAPVDAKNISAHKSDAWAEGPPEHYRIQVHQQMLVTGAKKASLCGLLGGNKYIWCDVERDETLIRKIIHQGSAFWQRVQDRDAPAPDGSESAKLALSRMYPRETDAVIALPLSMSDTIAAMQAARKEETAAHDRAEAAAQALKAALGSAVRGICPDGYEISWKTQAKREYIVKASTTRVLRVQAPKK